MALIFLHHSTNDTCTEYGVRSMQCRHNAGLHDLEKRGKARKLSSLCFEHSEGARLLGDAGLCFAQGPVLNQTKVNRDISHTCNHHSCVDHISQPTLLRTADCIRCCSGLHVPGCLSLPFLTSTWSLCAILFDRIISVLIESV